MSEGFDIDFYMIFLNFQISSWSSCFINAITDQELHALCWNFTGIFSTSTVWTTLMLTFVWPFWTSKLASCQMGGWSCLVNVTWQMPYLVFQRRHLHSLGHCEWKVKLWRRRIQLRRVCFMLMLMWYTPIAISTLHSQACANNVPKVISKYLAYTKLTSKYPEQPGLCQQCNKQISCIARPVPTV